MKAVSYRNNYDSDLPTDEDMIEKFGKLIAWEDTAGSYEVAETKLFTKDGKTFYWLSADDCSCWDGGYEGWELSREELLTLASARAQDEDGYSGLSHEKLLGQWVESHQDNLEPTNG
jgi:hypothetical protein